MNNYKFIKNPLTNRNVNIASKIGKEILKKYIYTIKKGGSNLDDVLFQKFMTSNKIPNNEGTVASLKDLIDLTSKNKMKKQKNKEDEKKTMLQLVDGRITEISKEDEKIQIGEEDFIYSKKIQNIKEQFEKRVYNSKSIEEMEAIAVEYFELIDNKLLEKTPIHLRAEGRRGTLNKDWCEFLVKIRKEALEYKKEQFKKTISDAKAKINLNLKMREEELIARDNEISKLNRYIEKIFKLIDKSLSKLSLEDINKVDDACYHTKDWLEDNLNKNKIAYTEKQMELKNIIEPILAKLHTKPPKVNREPEPEPETDPMHKMKDEPKPKSKVREHGSNALALVVPGQPKSKVRLQAEAELLAQRDLVAKVKCANPECPQMIQHIPGIVRASDICHWCAWGIDRKTVVEHKKKMGTDFGS